MKKIISALLVIAGLTASLTGCAESSKISDVQNSSVQETTKAVRISTAPIDNEIIGKWWNGKSGYIFGEDRKVSLVMDFSAMNINFTSDGEFNKAGEIIGKDNISYDGNNLMVQYEIENDVNIILNMKRNDDENLDSFDGFYTIYGGLLMEYLAENVGLNLNDIKKGDDIEFLAEVNGESLILTVENYCDYETIENSLEMFSKYMNYVDESADAVKYDYKIDGNTLTMTFYVDDSEFDEVYERVEE